MTHVPRIAKVIECAFGVHVVLQLSLMPPELTVVAGVIEREGKILICQRKPGGRHPLKWEFPGGKVEPGEDPRDALKRELLEELGTEAEIGAEISQYRFNYGEGPPIQLRFFRVNSFEGELRNLDFAQIVWAPPERLPDYDFLEGDLAFIALLSSRQGRSD